MPPGLDTEKSDSESKMNTQKPDSDGSFQKLPGSKINTEKPESDSKINTEKPDSDDSFQKLPDTDQTE